MKKVYSTLFAAACLSVSVSVSAQDAKIEMTPGYTINKTTNYTLDQLTDKYAPEVNVRAQAPARANGTPFCEDAMIHFNNMLFRYDSFNHPVYKSTENGKDVYEIQNCYVRNNSPEGVTLRLEVDENNKVVVPLQKIVTIPQFWSNGESLELFVADGATMIKNSDKRLWNQAAIPGLEAATTYDPTVGLARLNLMYCFETELSGNGETFTSLYPFCYVFYSSAQQQTGISDQNYTPLRSESIQLGDYDDATYVTYSDAFLPALGFQPETFTVLAQRNNKFSAVIRIVDVYANCTQLNPDDFMMIGSERNPGVMLVYNLDDKTNYVGNTYANLNIQGFENPDFQFQSYVNFMMQDSGSTIDQMRALKNLSNNGTVLYDKNPLGIITDGHMTVGDYCNLYYPMVENETVGAIPVQPAPFFVSNSLFDLQIPASGVESVIADDVNAPVEYYNIQGVRVDNPTNGLYIRRQGTTATKVIL